MSDAIGQAGVDWVAEVQGAVERLTTVIDDAKKDLKILGPLRKSAVFDDPRKLASVVAKVGAMVTGSGRVQGEAALIVERLVKDLAEAPKRRRETLGLGLKAACQSAGLEMRVIDRESPIRLRIPPFAVTIDIDSGVASFAFALQPLEKCGADAEKIVALHRQLRTKMETSFAPEAYFDDCLAAYRMALAACNKAFGERIEFDQFLPLLALRMQPKNYRVEPISKNHRSYSRAQFAFDVMRLREAGVLERAGRRIQFGVATGNSTAQKSRVLFLEDADGNGEFKVSVSFTEEDR